MLAQIRSWLQGLLRRDRIEQEMSREMEFHLNARADELFRVSREEAVRNARIEFGSQERFKEEARASRGLRMADELRADLRYAARGLRSSKGFAAVVVLSLALGIGANTAMFSVVNGVLLRPLPYKDQERLVAISEQVPESFFSLKGATMPPPSVNFLLHRDQIRSFDDVLAYDLASYQVVDAAEPEELQAGWVTANLCPLLGVKPVIGRCFTGEDLDQRAKIAVLSYGVWLRQFGGDPQALGRTIRLKNFSGTEGFTVIGVLPPGFTVIRKPDLWMPISQSQNFRSRNTSWTPAVTIAKLKPGLSVQAARTELLSMQRQMYPKANESSGGRQVIVLPIADYMAQTLKPGLAILLGAVGLILLITCANVANLLLSRGAVRAREIAVRESLGASRFRVCRQILTEALTLAALGGAAGLGAAYWVLQMVKELAGTRLPRVEEIGIDWRVLAFTALVSVLSGAFFGLLPALRLSRVDLVDAMKSGGAGAFGGTEQHRVMNLLLVFQTALCLIAMMGAGLLVNTFVRLTGIDPGFRSGGVIVASLNTPPAAAPFLAQVMERVRVVPGVESVAATTNPPPFHVLSVQDFRRPGTADTFGPNSPRANMRVVTPDYFRTMSIPLLSGRSFNATDQAIAPHVAIVGSSLARHYWPGENPLGKTIILRAYRAETPVEIVGVAGDVRQAGLKAQPDDMLYLNYAQSVTPFYTLLVRVNGGPEDFFSAIKQAARSVDKNQSLTMLTTMDRLLADEVAEPRFYMILLTAFGVLALALTMLGVGGLVAYAVSRRTREIGLRISFGAAPANLLRTFAWGSLKLVAAGVVLGAAGSWAVTRYTKSLLYEITPTDPATFAAVTVLLTGVSLAVCCAVALRATRVDPAIVLRHE
jgi:putative ABC transport system permease protein